MRARAKIFVTGHGGMVGVALQRGGHYAGVDTRCDCLIVVDTSFDHASNFKVELDWEPPISFDDPVQEMMVAQMASARRNDLVERGGFPTCNLHE